MVSVPRGAVPSFGVCEMSAVVSCTIITWFQVWAPLDYTATKLCQ